MLFYSRCAFVCPAWRKAIDAHKFLVAVFLDVAKSLTVNQSIFVKQGSWLTMLWVMLAPCLRAICVADYDL